MLNQITSTLKNISCDQARQIEIQNKRTDFSWRLDCKLSTNKNFIDTVITFNDSVFITDCKIVETEIMKSLKLRLFETAEDGELSEILPQNTKYPRQLYEDIKRLRIKYTKNEETKQLVFSLRPANEEQKNSLIQYLINNETMSFKLTFDILSIINKPLKDVLKRIKDKRFY
ncbi:hypothetical protein CDIK_1211 [Cucumispora dikerogammari]|nr:hypothetical protein CDIK_1211 [Cucumispora dikerogammari]